MYIYIYTFHNKKWKALDFDVSMSRMDKLLSEEAICNVGSIVCCSFNCCQYFLHEKNFIGDKGVLENVLWRSKGVWFRHPTMIALKSWCHEAKVYHYLRCWNLWKSLVQNCGFGTINMYVIQAKKLTWLHILIAWKQRNYKEMVCCMASCVQCGNLHYEVCRCYVSLNERHWRWSTQRSSCDSRNMEPCSWAKWWGAKGNLDP